MTQSPNRQRAGRKHAEPVTGSRSERGKRSIEGVACVYLARHGRTPLNAAGLLRGRLDPPLDDLGRAEAARLGSALADAGVRLVVASPLQRAVDTARPVAERAGLEVEIEARLIDRDYGSWAGQPRQAVIDRWGSLDRAPGVEAGGEVAERALQALADIAERARGAAAVVVSHDAVNRAVLSLLDPSLGDPEAVPQATGCYNVLERRGETWSIRSVNNIPTEPGGITV
ncbi:MAG: histidine phosphatase family protein [Acidimicrobiaceae bacterium]|nr:histidine phosphatase family protein [Acidimicrobiaceae bacterium]